MCRLLGFAAAGSNTSLNGVLGMQAVRDFRDLSEIHNDGWGSALVTVLRGLPEILVVLFIYFGSSQLLLTLSDGFTINLGFAQIPVQMQIDNFDVSPFLCGVIALSLLYAAYASQTLRGDMLRNLSATSVADALKYFSGVQIKDYGGLGGLKTVNVRSLGSQHVGVYLDGKIGRAHV